MDAPEDDVPGAPPVRRERRRRAWTVGIAAVVIIGLVGTIIALLIVRQPVSTSDRTPERTELTEKVEKRALVSKVIGRGTVASVGSTSITCHPATGGGDVKVFTRPAEQGKQLKEGDLLAAINGRPVLVLQGKVAAFRDMLPGSTGPDVTQLQQSLVRLGYSISDTPGTMGPATQAAVTSLYSKAGFVAKAPTPDEAARLRAAQDAVAQSEVTITQASTAIKEAKKGPSRSAILGAKLAISEAETRVSQAATPAERSLALKQLDIAKASYDELFKTADLSGLNASYNAAVKARDRAKTELAAISASTGTSVPYCEVVFLPETPVTVSAVAGKDGAKTGEGATAANGWATLSPGSLVLRSELNPNDKALVEKDAKVAFRADDSSTDRTGKISSIDETGVTIVPDEPFTEEERDKNLRVSIVLKQTAGEVLVVPLAAVSGTADGLAKVVKVSGSERVDVPVRAGLTADGFVEIQPVTDGTLTVGDAVVVGR